MIVTGPPPPDAKAGDPHQVDPSGDLGCLDGVGAYMNGMGEGCCK